MILSSHLVEHMKIIITSGLLRGVEISLLLSFADVLLITNTFVAKPIRNLCKNMNINNTKLKPFKKTGSFVTVDHLRNGNATFSREFFFRFFWRIRIWKVWIKVFIENFWRLFTKVTSFTTSVQKSENYNESVNANIEFINVNLTNPKINLDRNIITASQVDCLSCIWIELNFLWIIWTIRSISYKIFKIMINSKRSNIRIDG